MSCPQDVGEPGERSSRAVFWAVGLLTLAWVAIGAAGLGALLKTSYWWWCPELPTPPWVLLYEIGELVAILATIAASLPTAIITEERIMPLRRRLALIALWCLAVGACVLLGIEHSRLIPSGCG